MVDEAIGRVVRQYLRNLAAQGLAVRLGVVFGSCAAGNAGPGSDIDVVVVSPAFDGAYPRELVSRLWRTAARTDSRIEPIPCGERQWREEQASPILEIARQQGVAVNLEGAVAEGEA